MNPFVFLIQVAQDFLSLTSSVHEALTQPITLNLVIDLPKWLNDFGIADFNVGDLISSALSGIGITTYYSLIFGGGIFVVLGFGLIKMIKVW